MTTALWNFAVGLAELIQQKQNSIWSFIIRNSYRPAMMRQQFDVIVGNPPWVAYRYVSDPEYQKEIKHRAVVTYKIAPQSQKLFTQMELATVFLAHSMAIFAKLDGKLAFVMPRSVLTGDQHQNLIQRRYSAPFRLTGYWDLWDVEPLFNVPSCVLFADRSERHGSSRDKIPAETWSGRLSVRDLPWDKVESKFSVIKGDARVVWLGTRSALSTEAGASSATRSSAYAQRFKQGATIVPRNCFFVSVDGLEGQPEPDSLYHARTDEESALDSKQPYREVRLRGNVEGRFLFSTAISRHVLPFALLPPSPVVLPLELSNGSYYTVTTQALKRKGFREFAKWMENVEQVWKEKRAAKSDKQSVLQRLDYQRGLTSQSLRQRHLVLYNSAGTNVSATYCDRAAVMLPLIVEHKLYWAAFDGRQEAYFVTAILNSDTANQAIKPFQSTGLLGERDIEKKLLDFPTPIFDKNDLTHRRLSFLGMRAHRQARLAVRNTGFPPGTSLARRRGYIRTALTETLSEIDVLVIELLRPS